MNRTAQSKISFSLLVGVLLVVWCSGCETEPGSGASAEALLGRACAYLWAQQGDDGGWHSPTHGLLRGGQPWTPYVLSALLEAPQEHCPAPARGIARARRFIVQHVDADGVLGVSDPDVMEYPNYATAYALRVLAHLGDPEDAPLRERMEAYLKSQQFTEARGIGPDHPAYGAWGFGERHLAFGTTGHTDLSHTRRILQALRRAGRAAPESDSKARAFLGLIQKDPHDPRLERAGLVEEIMDGGFFASSVTLDVNKSAPVQEVERGLWLFGSYATATCDGILALLAAGAAPEDPSVRSAAAWLRAHPELEYPEGVVQETPEQWHRVLFYYHLAGRAEVYAALGWEGGWRASLVRTLEGRQGKDGSFSNPYGALNKEDDPLLATAMAVQVLGHALTTPGPALP
jgi:hypothetical protein